jgi:hypothetical protein
MNQSITDHNSILFTSNIAPDGRGFVQWQQGQYSGHWDAEQAIALGTALLMVTGIAMTEGSIAISLMREQDLHPSSDEYQLKLREILQAIRASRFEITDALKPIFGFQSQQPLVEIGWYKTARTVSIDGAMEEARLILEAANAAIVDGMLSRSMTEAGIKDKLQQKVFNNLREGREAS